jgi:hypothetical protein
MLTFDIGDEYCIKLRKELQRFRDETNSTATNSDIELILKNTFKGYYIPPK